MGYKQNFKSPSMLKMLGDLNKDGKMSAYETKRQNAIEKSMDKQEKPAATKQTARPADPPKMTDAERKMMAKTMSKSFADGVLQGAPSVLSVIEPTEKMTKKVVKKAAKKSNKEAKDSLQKLAPSAVTKQTKSKPEHMTSRKKTEQARAKLMKKTRVEKQQLDVKRTSVDKGERSKKMGVTTVKERQAQRDAARKAERKSGPSNPRKMSQPKSKNSGQKKTLDGNVIKY